MNVASSEPAQSYLQLRERILNLNPTELGLKPSIAFPHAWGVIMETGYDAGSAMLVALADGTTSLYYSTGGGIIGSGGYSPVAEASKKLVSQADDYVRHYPATTDFPLPEVGQVKFYFMSYDGVRVAETTEDELTSGKRTLSPLYQHAQASLKQLHQLSSKKRG